ncbi:hypothetical protein TNCT_151341 [Trichonephila clavata]|uniref:Uncharacterized protein n=1 Tax=Trichonephila clavata TaxID=2740835 RepID=A0A8X6H147_TRICU|nr:hypothetical protein TNCT_151341 [Trichonephila clavata]
MFSLIRLFLMKNKTKKDGAVSKRSIRSLFGHYGCKPRVSSAAWKTNEHLIDKDAGLEKSCSSNPRMKAARTII